MTDWDQRFLAMARLVGAWSKDPSTQTGCVVTRPDRTIASVGYNGLPRGVADTTERLTDRPTKYAMTVHAEINALLAAREPLHGCSVYVDPWPPCAPCSAALIQAGVRRVVSPSPTAEQRERWADSWALAESMLSEAGVELVSICKHDYGRLNGRFWCCKCGADGGPAPTMATPNPSAASGDPVARETTPPSPPSEQARKTP